MTVEELNHILSDHLLWLNENSTGKRADLAGQDLSGLDLSWANLADANLAGANLSGANLSHADLSRSDLRGANLAGANLTGANLDGAQFEVSELEKADFESKPSPQVAKPEAEEETSDEPILEGSPSPESADDEFTVSDKEDREGEESESEPPGTGMVAESDSPIEVVPPPMTETGSMATPPLPPAPAPAAAPPPAPSIETAAIPPHAPAPEPSQGGRGSISPGGRSDPRRKRSTPFSRIGSKISGMFKKEDKEVAVSSYVPGKIVREEPFTIQCWVHSESDRSKVKARAESSGHASEAGAKSGLVIEKGTLVELSIKPVSLVDVSGNRDPQSKTIRWQGYPSDEEFVFVWPGDAPDVIYETVEISVEGVPLGDCTLCLRIDQESTDNLVSEFRRIKRAFVSYDHDDSQRVLASVQAFQTITNVDLFLDVDDLRAGVDWEEKLRSEVSSRDALFLYWSEQAAQSEWVDREWRLALAERGITYIKPMPLDPVPPPEELSQLQFADKWSRLAEYQRLKEATT